MYLRQSRTFSEISHYVHFNPQKMKKVILNSVAITFIFSFIFVGCKKDEKKEEEKKVEQNGLTQEINQLVPDSIMTFMVDLGMPINRGGIPPNITGSYIARPFILKASNIPNDYVGYQFVDYNVTFYDQDNEKLSVKLDYVNGPESGTGLGSFIVGSNSEFSIFAEVNSTNAGTNATLVIVISGILKDNGIHNLYFANFMIDNNGNPTGNWISNGEGRVIYDSDSLSERVTDTKKAYYESFNGHGVSSPIK